MCRVGFFFWRTCGEDCKCFEGECPEDFFIGCYVGNQSVQKTPIGNQLTM